MNKKCQYLSLLGLIFVLFSFSSYAQTLAPEIMRLQDGDEIPASVFEKYDSVTIGRSLVARVYQTRDKLQASPGPGYYDFQNDSRLEIVFPDFEIEKFTTLGFLNSHQARRQETNPIYAGDVMLNAESAM